MAGRDSLDNMMFEFVDGDDENPDSSKSGLELDERTGDLDLAIESNQPQFDPNTALGIELDGADAPALEIDDGPRPITGDLSGDLSLPSLSVPPLAAGSGGAAQAPPSAPEIALPMLNVAGAGQDLTGQAPASSPPVENLPLPGAPNAEAPATRDPAPAADAPAPGLVARPASGTLPVPSHVTHASVFASIPGAFIVPFKGRGALWIPVLILLLIVTSFMRGLSGLLIQIGYLGLLANYFAKSVSTGMDDEDEAPPFRFPDNFLAEMVLPGLALIGLSIVLWAPPVYLMASTAINAAEKAETHATGRVTTAAPEEGSDRRPLDFSESFRSKDGEIVKFTKGDRPQVVQRNGGDWVKVYPSQGYLMVLPIDYLLTELAYIESGGKTDEVRRDSGSSVLAGLDIPISKIVPIILLVCFAFLWWPLALTAGALQGNALHVFNPLKIGPAIVKGGAEYAVIAVIGAVLMVAPTLIVATTSDSYWLIAIVSLGSFAYTAGVQGHLVGRLIAAKPGMFPDFAKANL